MTIAGKHLQFQAVHPKSSPRLLFSGIPGLLGLNRRVASRSSRQPLCFATTNRRRKIEETPRLASRCLYNLERDLTFRNLGAHHCLKVNTPAGRHSHSPQTGRTGRTSIRRRPQHLRRRGLQKRRELLAQQCLQGLALRDPRSGGPQVKTMGYRHAYAELLRHRVSSIGGNGTDEMRI
jgi:hypothetical protein